MSVPADNGGELTVYFHGIPGSPAELALGDADVHSRWLEPDRNDPALGTDFEHRLDALADLITARHPLGPLRLIGFSLGAMTALRLAPRLGRRVARIDLISAAAPLDGGPFLPLMAGGPVFAAAGNWPAGFSVLARMQSLLARRVPLWLARQLFASAAGADVELMRSEQFRALITQVLREGLGHSSHGYRAEIAAYVRPWAHELARVEAPVTLWHGQLDTWSPPDMADYLAQALPNLAAFHRLDRLSHYSALAHFLQQSGR